MGECIVMPYIDNENTSSPYRLSTDLVVPPDLLHIADNIINIVYLTSILITHLPLVITLDIFQRSMPKFQVFS